VADQNTPEAEQTVAPGASAESSQAADAPAEQTTEQPAEAESTPQPEAEKAPEAEAAAQAEPAAEAESDDAASAEEIETEEVVMPDGSKRMVRVLAVGQQVTGTVKRIADFGAFIDIGVGRDGLIHISELSVRRVGKVTDVLSEGQEVTAWIKKLDRERNRISLTLIDPETKTIRDLKKGEIVNGTVTRILPYGAFVDIGIGRDALLHVREMAEGYVAKPEDVVKVGEELEARVIELSRRRGRVDLSLKGLRPEPEVAQPVVEAAPQVEEADDYDDQFDDVEVLSPMEMAFKRAIEAEGTELKPMKKKGKRGRRGSARSIQDEIIERTLSNR
jgi:predicted RNA-binding protein with RPS1 domain